MRIIFTLVVAFTISGIAAAQNGGSAWNWPSDPEMDSKAKAKNALYNDSRKMGNYKESLPHLMWLLKNTPDLNPSIYINGAKIYEAMVDLEKDEAAKKVYQDSALIMYDLRIKHFGKEGYVLNRKASKAYRYKRGDKSKYPELMELFEKVFELNSPTKILDNNTIGYFDIVRRHKLSGGDISEDRILEIYEEINGVIDQKIKAKKNVKRLNEYKSTIDGMLAAMVKIDCEFIENKLGPKFEADPSDLKLAKSIVGHALNSKCTELPVAIKAAEAVYENEPEYGVALLIAFKSRGNKDYDKAIKYFKEAIGLTEDNAKIGQAYIEIGNIYRLRGNKTAARENYRHAVAADPSKKEAYTNIGDLYFGSFETCAKKVSMVEDRGVYMAAYKMYKLAGNSSRMAKAKEQFPSAEEIFTETKEVGSSMKVGCWINETVQIDKR
ncbi:tetratricopeptide repeat protein [Fulvivirgaceae bacterium BMA12]|uniref:Tetratricopeptide repeat protein n=1 Tax=Agaribacillus aureus TaxID=3051825 RepID=A0ABT8LF17_9BACT|nr:tetratricopeptide repeat protein [Fulvivirgaceae bacterium BMA12]